MERAALVSQGIEVCLFPTAKACCAWLGGQGHSEVALTRRRVKVGFVLPELPTSVNQVTEELQALRMQTCRLCCELATSFTGLNALQQRPHRTLRTHFARTFHAAHLTTKLNRARR